MNQTELIDALEDAGQTLSECGSHVALDLGQKQMVAEAEVRVAQTVRELRLYSEPADITECIDIEEAEDEGWTH